MSELLTNVSTSVVSMVYNIQLMKYFSENGVSAYGVLMYTQFIFMAIFFGYTTGTAPIISFHYGADNKDELKSLFRKNLKLKMCIRDRCCTDITDNGGIIFFSQKKSGKCSCCCLAVSTGYGCLLYTSR